MRVFTVASGPREPTIQITAKPSGRCWQGSLVAQRPDAWRCFVGNEIEDPCFTGGAASVVCPTGGPWTGSGIEIRLNQPLPTNRANTGEEGKSRRPWALQTVGGLDCQFAAGVTSVVDGMRLNYICGSDKLWLYGEPNRSTSSWKIYGSTMNGSQLTPQNIAVAWF